MKKVLLVTVFSVFALSSAAHALQDRPCDPAKLNGGCPSTEQCDANSKVCKDLNSPGAT